MPPRNVPLTDSQKQALADGKQRAKVANRIVGFPIGARVRVHDRTRWNNSTGVISSHNLGEIGIKIKSTEIWCLPSQVEILR